MNSFLEIFFFFYSFNLSNDDIISLPRIHVSCVLCPPLGLQTGMHFRGYVCKWVWKMTFFGLK